MKKILKRCKWCGKVVWPFQRSETNKHGIYHQSCLNTLHYECVNCGAPCKDNLSVEGTSNKCGHICEINCGIIYASTDIDEVHIEVNE